MSVKGSASITPLFAFVSMDMLTGENTSVLVFIPTLALPVSMGSIVSSSGTAYA